MRARPEDCEPGPDAQAEGPARRHAAFCMRSRLAARGRKEQKEQKVKYWPR